MDNKGLQVTYCLHWKDINNLFIKQFIMDKIDFLKHIFSNFLNICCQFLFHLLFLEFTFHISKNYCDFYELVNFRIKFIFSIYNTRNF